MALGSRKETMASFLINNHEVRSTECLKLLGVCIDKNNLRFDEHINSMSKKSSQRVGVLKRNLIPTQTKLQLYKGAVLLYLTYCHLISWLFCHASDSRRLERFQERAR